MVGCGERGGGRRGGGDMTKDFFGYDKLVENALRTVVREALRAVADRGLVGNHHLYLTFDTRHPEVEVPDHLRERYPDELTIVLQHQYWDLVVGDDAFEVTLSFDKVRSSVHVPYAALTRFADPGVKFGLQFASAAALAEGTRPAPVALVDEEDAPEQTETTPDEAAGADDDEAAAPDSGGEAPEGEASDDDKVVALDTFRKK